MGGASRGPPATDPLVADLERAEPHALLERRAVGADLRRAAQTCASGAEGRRSGIEDGARRAPERELEGARGDLRRRAPAARSTSSRCTPTPGIPKNVVRTVKIVRREMARRGDGKMPIWITELSWPAAQGKTPQHGGFETTEKGQADRLKEGLPLLAERAHDAPDRARVLVHVALHRGHHRQRLRLLRAAPRARRPARSVPRRSTSSRAWPVACRAARSSPATHVAVADARTLEASCGGEMATGLSWRTDRSGGCSPPRWRAASRS